MGWQGGIMKKSNLVSINDIGKSDILEIFKLADYSDRLFSEFNSSLSGNVLGTFFFQSSTRTQFSFQSAFVKLGGSYIGCSDINSIRCSYPYFEAMDDFAKIISNYCDIIVMRSGNEDEMNSFINSATIPVISAGCGRLEHPTQALIDLYSINQFIGSISNNNILIIGTPNQRTINSLLLGLNMWANIEVLILCQEGGSLRSSIESKLTNITVNIFTSWDKLIDSNKLSTVSIIYVGEIYNESPTTNQYILNKKILSEHFSKDVIVLSPLPRTNELSKDIDSHAGAKYFLQARMGMYVRAGLFIKYFI